MTLWGYILQGPGRPSRRKQLEILGVLGVPLQQQFPPIWRDEIKHSARGIRAGERQLSGRNDLLLAAQRGDKVAVAAPFCLGLSKKDAAWFLAELERRGVSLVVANDAWEVKPGGNAERLLAALETARNTVNVARYRNRAAS